MSKLATVVLIAAALFVSLAGTAQAVTLVSPDGTPVGGQWQQWVDQMKVPTVAGNLIFSTDASQCLGAPACSLSLPRILLPMGFRILGSGPIWTAVDPSDPNARRDLAFELGHQFDWRYLTPRERRHLIRAWYPPKWTWMHPARLWNALRPGEGEGGWEAIFPIIYADCAAGVNDQGAIVTTFQPDIPVAYPNLNTCRYIKRIAERVGADMESTAY